jgi:hypothetical protein
MGKSKEQTKKLPPKTEVNTTVFVKKKGTRKREGILKIGKSKDSADAYYKDHGVLPLKDKDENFLTKLIDGLEGLPDRAKEMTEILNYKEKDDKGMDNYDNTIYTQTFASPEAEDFNVVFGKFREFLNDNKLAIVDQLKPSVKITSAYMKEDPADPAIKHEYLIDDANSEADEESMIFFKQNYDLIVEFLTEPLPPGVSLTVFTYSKKDLNISDDKNEWTEGDMRILQNLDNRENAFYVIGQVFNIIDPKFIGNFVTDEFNEKLEVEKGFVEILTKDIPKFFGFINTSAVSSSPISDSSLASVSGFL